MPPSAPTSLKITPHPSPNCGERRNGAAVSLVVLHYTAMDTAEAALERLCDPEAEVSAHFLIAENGQVFQLVEEQKRAWHAGAGAWGDITDVNSHSIGIELANRGAHPFAAAQMDALEHLLAGLFARHDLTPERVIGHSDMASGRKIDPGPRFDWARLAKQGFAVFVQEDAPDQPDEKQFLFDLDKFGYPEAAAETRLASFRSRFFPHKTGPLDGADCATARRLAACFPVDPSTSSA